MEMRNMMLAKRDGLGSIQRCCHGVVHIHLNGISLRFKEDAFIDFALIVKEASSRLIEEGISQLLSESDEEDK